MILISIEKKQKLNSLLWWSAGVAFTFLIAFWGYLFSLLPGLNNVGQLACAIIIAVIYRHFFGYPMILKNGIVFSSQKLLRLAIILYGLKLNIDVILRDGLGLLLRDGIIIASVILLTVWAAKIFKADSTISLLLGVGTGVCGAAAIAAIAPIVKSKDEDTAISVGIIALVGTVFAVGYTLIEPVLPLSSESYGIWAGSTLHELAHVAIAAEPAGEDALAISLLAKLGRVFLLVPLAFIFILIMNRKEKGKQTERNKVQFPWFLVGFLLMSIIGSYVIDNTVQVTDNIMEDVSTLTTWLLTAAMVGLGLNVNLSDLRSKAFKPLIIMIIVSLILSVLTYFSV